MSLPAPLRDEAFRWMADDPDADTTLELQRVVANAMGGAPGAVDDLADRMNGTLAFGTAGLRGPVRAGSNGMNRAVVLRATAGVAAWLVHKGHSGGLVVVGRDARHGSAEFAVAATEVLVAAGFRVATLPGPLPTPVTAFLVRSLGAVAGLQITASHNPPADNGYKVYTDDGAQIVPPDDRLIEAGIRDAPPARLVPTSPGGQPVPGIDDYLARVATLPRGTARDLRVVLTPLHGVGGDTARQALAAAGFTDVTLVAEQADPDPDFPTVTFPNPEEPGAADLLLATAEAADADLAIALDPDADRCALGVRFPDGWRMLTGDETGSLVGDHILSTVDKPDPLVATTIVSSSQLALIAAAHHARHTETLTGFKWLARAGEGLVFAYEEALGVCVDPDAVRDKDGISAAVVACDLAATLKAAGRGLPDALDDLARTHGVHLTAQISLRFTDLARIGPLVAGLRATPPTTLTGTPVTQDNPAPDVLRLRGEGLRVIVRPSGTEPKVKAYLEITEPPTDDLPAAREKATARLTALRTEVESLLNP
ncbi:phosphomannomutase [Actinophytocola xinjiangensis]|uniref:Phosphomannomutase n=1 Tax=Actinophytocola xinjiangensis TaxID=485602 RepID=A0A7Z1ATA3_9PSEU|nr:phospho-sugar mutase [Actinophytocola xinjiangensis]OLF04589.1 phosphomannomutase [Actinophytocola xinjiangensis]